MYDNKKVSGALLFFAGVLHIWIVVIAESLYPGYSISNNYISELGLGKTALLFNSALILFGLATVGGAYFSHRHFNSRLFTIFLALLGIGGMLVGLFPMNFVTIHSFAAFLIFVFGALSVIFSYRLLESPLSHMFIVLGVIGLAGFVLFATGVYLGLGVGGMERMAVYPILFWEIGFGGTLIGARK